MVQFSPWTGMGVSMVIATLGCHGDVFWTFWVAIAVGKKGQLSHCSSIIHKPFTVWSQHTPCLFFQRKSFFNVVWIAFPDSDFLLPLPIFLIQDISDAALKYASNWNIHQLHMVELLQFANRSSSQYLYVDCIYIRSSHDVSHH